MMLTVKEMSVLWKIKEFFAWVPTWLEDIDQQGHRIKVKKVWLCKVIKFKSLDGWIALIGDNRHLL